MFSISKYARALPALLDLKERGSGPRSFSDQVVGTISMDALYLLQGRETFNPTNQTVISVGANAWGATLTVPPGEIWFVWEYSVASSPGAGAAVTLCPSLSYDGVGNIPLCQFQSAAANEVVRNAMVGTRWATPGTEFSFIVKAQTLSPTVSGSIQVTKLRI
jgi:hypothetical protein